MRGLSHSLLVLAVSVLALASVPAMAAASPVQDPVPIGPNQYFTGLVNGHPGHAVIRVVCPGPTATTGNPAGKQPVEVETAPSSSAADVGYTGSTGRSVTAALSMPTLSIAIANFTSYYVKEDIPTNIAVPCSGSGSVTFGPEHGGKKAHAATLEVTFKSIAASATRR